MRAGKLRTIAVGVVLMSAGWCMAQSNITLVADADATIREADNNPQFENILEVRSRLNAGSGRQRIPYIRYDLRVLVNAPQTGAVFTVSSIGGSYATGELQVYGLLDVLGNTPQGWIDSGFVYTASGLEVPGDGNAETQDLDTSRLHYLGDLPGADGDGSTVSLSGAFLDAFLADRYANGGLATVMLVESNGVDNYVQFGQTEGTDPPPSLQLVGELQVLPPDTTSPTVAGVSPTTGATGVLLESDVTVTFSEVMDEATITTNTVVLRDASSNLVAAAVTYNAGTLTATLDPDGFLNPAASYTAWTLGGPGGIADAAGNTMAADFSWSFITEDLDVVPPAVIAVSPTNGAVDVEFYAKVLATFSEEMDPASITTNTFQVLDASNNPVPAAVTYDAGSFTATFFPTDALNRGETYTAILVSGPGGVADEIGNPLAADFSWVFTTTTPGGGAFTLIPVADTYTRDGVGAGTAANLDVRGFGGGDFIAYIRFDLSGIVSISDATLTLHETGGSRNDSIVVARHEVYGLTDAAGNTPQDWDEGTDLDAGAEFDNTGGNDVDPSQVFVLDPEQGASVVEDVPGSDDVDVSITGPDLVTFLNERMAAGGLATFIVAINSDDRGYGFASRENPTFAPPLLTLSAGLQTSVTGIERVAGPAMVVTWEPQANHAYGVERTVDDLSASTWVTVASNLVGATVNAYTDAAPVAVHASYRVVDEGEIQLFADTFDGPDMGWTAGSDGTTAWQVGAPSLGPGAAQSAPNCYVTNLGGDYGSNADISLLSPVIDLTAVTNGVLAFDHFVDVEGDTFDFCEVYARDDAGAEIPALVAPLATYNPGLPSLAWEPVSLILPAEAQARTVRFEFRFVSDSGTEWTGWYIDNVRVITQ